MSKSFKIQQIFMIFAVLVLVSACSSTDDEILSSEPLVSSDRQDVTQGDPLSDVYGEQVAVTNNTGPTPGSQADLVVNIGDRVFFGYDSYDLTQEARATLEQQAAWMNTHQALSVTVEGHADERGTREYNLALAERRATAVRNYLVALGVSPSRVGTISYGKERPAVVGANSTSWAQNRRGVTVVN